MIRTIISLRPDEKQWLEQRARLENVSAAALIRGLIAARRQESEQVAGPGDDLLDKTSGIWHQAEGLEYQRKIRAEW